MPRHFSLRPASPCPHRRLSRRSDRPRAIAPGALAAERLGAGLLAVALLAVALLGLAGPVVRVAAQEPALDPAHAAKMAHGLKLFKQEVRPVLVGRCVKCHGGESVEGEFNLTSREELLRGGGSGAVVKLGSAKESLLYKLITHQEEPHMPEDGAKLSQLAIDKIAEWLDLGAPYDKPIAQVEVDPARAFEREVPVEAREFWSFLPLAEAAPPALAPAGRAWARNDIDAFIYSALQEKGLTPNGPVDRRALARRAHFDLIGLPPTPEETRRFVDDPRSDAEAYNDLLDRLLASPHYGERWGRHWLDVARFAESHGFEQDYDRPHAYHYRDFVIHALNADMPFDQFVRWQIAGDELAPGDPWAMMATGFLGAGVFPTQITKNEVERSRYDALDDMAATTGTAMLGLTIGCARCHDHKFDPIPMGDYYRLVSTFTTAVRSNIDLQFDSDNHRQARAEFDRAHAPLAEALARFEREALPARLAAWEASPEARAAPRSSGWSLLEVGEAKSAGGATLTKQDDGSWLAGGANPDFDTYTFVAATEARGVTAIRLEALAHPALVKGGPGRAGNGNFALTNLRLQAAPKSNPAAQVDVKLTWSAATFEQGPSLLAKFAVDNDSKSAWAVDPQFGKDHAAVFETAEDVGFEGGTVLTFTLEFKNNAKHNLGRPRLAISTAARPATLEGDALPAAVARALGAAPEQRAAADSAALLAWYKLRDPEWKKLRDQVQAHLARAPQPDVRKVMVVSEGVTPIRHHTQGADFFNETYYLKRGDSEQKAGVASQSFLQVLMRAPDKEKRWQRPPPSGARTSFRRAALAEWLVDTDQGAGHLLARVMANRLWQHHFGRGIVSTPNDFGYQGERPTHPELLDWLAGRLIAGGWKLKPAHKLLMTSATYLQSTAHDAADARIDPENQWHWRRSPRRLEAEIIRDAMLAVSGQLDPKLYGPGTLDENHKRRSVYFMIKRSRLVTMMQIFDQPEPLVSVGGRPSTTIAPQALLFLNGPQVRAMARELGKTAAQASPAEAVDALYWRTLSRGPSAEETSVGAAFLTAQEASYRAGGRGDAKELAAADLAQALFSLNEFVYVD